MVGERAFHPATTAEVRKLRRTLVAASVFSDETELAAVAEADPWRIQVTGRGDVAVLTRWRDHLDILAIEALWCRDRSIGDAVTQLRALALERGFGDLLAPPTPLERLGPYEAAGMRVFEMATTFVRRGLQASAIARGAVAGVALRPATADDIDTVLDLDGCCFDDFWRYDQRHMVRFLASQRFVMATSAGTAIGYTLSTIQRGDGVLGRIAIVPEWRGQGVGRLLVADVLAYLREQGADRVSLCTQTDNEAARALYLASGFEDTEQHFAFARFG